MFGFRVVRSSALAAAMALAAFAPLEAHAQPGSGDWQFSATKEGDRMLSIAKNVEFAGKPASVKLSFSSGLDNPKENMFGALSIELSLAKPSAYPNFHFDDFEGPDSAIGARKLMKFRVLSAGKATSEEISPAGSYVDIDGKEAFTFEASELASKRHSPERKLLDALSAGADEFELTVTDSRDPHLALTVKVPVASEKERFQALLKGIK